MFLKQTAFKPRSNSQSSANDTAVDTTTAASTENTGSTYAGRRRSSATEKFAGLTAHKRTSGDASAAGKKASFADQKPGSQGVLGSMWSSFTKGT